MNTLNDFLKRWTDNKDVEDLIASGLLSDVTAIQDYIRQAPEEKKDDIHAILSDISKAVTEYIQNLDAQKIEVKGQIAQNLKSAQACLSYGSTSALDNKGRNKS